MKSLLICAPITSRSGYGAHARDLFRAFYELKRFDIKILDVRWGDCPRNALDPDNKFHKIMLDSILVEPRLEQQPDVYVDIRIPNEFETFGKYNIGITAGIETDIISNEWIEGCNKMDLVIVPSEHSKDGIVKTIYDKMENLPNGEQQKIGELQVDKPVEVLFEGANTEIYKRIDIDGIDNKISNYINDVVEEDFAFLFLGQWCQGGYGEDRKDIGKLIKVFYEAFANKKKKPALILKTSGATFSIIDRESTLTKIAQIKNMFSSEYDLPNVYLLHGNLDSNELNSLYNHPKIKTMVSFTHGEGFGRPLLEATMVGLPVIASGWSGHTDFLDRDNSLLLSGKVDKVPQSAVWDKIVLEHSKWFYVNEDEAYKAFNYVFKNIFDFKRKAEKLMHFNRDNFSLSAMTAKLGEILDEHMKNIPEAVGLNLPTLKKVSNNEPQKIKLPKLKKI
jgi:glycosyltransferase involved in cell wall biosynthesis